MIQVKKVLLPVLEIVSVKYLLMEKNTIIHMDNSKGLSLKIENNKIFIMDKPYEELSEKFRKALLISIIEFSSADVIEHLTKAFITKDNKTEIIL